MKLLRNIAIILLVVAVLAVIYVKKRTEQKGPLSDSIMVNIERGMSSQQVATVLVEDNVISNDLIFRILLKYHNVENKIKAGEYEFEPRVSMLEVMDKLLKGDVVYYKVTIPEGYTVGQVLYVLSMNDKLSGEYEKTPSEGMILPETYTFQKNEDRNFIINRAIQAMNAKLQEMWNNRDDNLPYKNMYELLIMASIIEKETSVDSERALVASVFVNRLRKGMKLQTDPSVIYALTEGKEELKRLLTRKDLMIDNEYNTYRYVGLPPTPICNPGEASLYAAAHPADTEYLYFVANGDGGHNFAKSLREHNHNVANWKKKKIKK